MKVNSDFSLKKKVSSFGENINTPEAHCTQYPWYLYKMVTQNIMRTHEENSDFSLLKERLI